MLFNEAQILTWNCFKFLQTNNGYLYLTTEEDVWGYRLCVKQIKRGKCTQDPVSI